MIKLFMPIYFPLIISPVFYNGVTSQDKPSVSGLRFDTGRPLNHAESAIASNTHEEHTMSAIARDPIDREVRLRDRSSAAKRSSALSCGPMLEAGYKYSITLLRRASIALLIEYWKRRYLEARMPEEIRAL